MTTAPSRRARILGLTAGGLLAGGVGLGVIGVVAANAAPVLTAATPSASASTGTDTDTETNDGGGHRSGETAVTGAKAETLKAAALQAVPGGTVVRVETDADDAAYEVHMTKSDGTEVTVKFDSALKEIGVEAGMGKGGRGGNDHDADDGTTSAG